MSDAGKGDPRGGNRIDARLAAFAAAGEYRLAAFEGCFHCTKGVQFLHLVG